MPVVVIAPEPFISLEEAKAHVRVDHDDEDTVIDAFIAAACGHIDGPAGWLGRAVGEQQLQLFVDEFPATADPLWLPYPPVIAVDEILYADGDGVEQTLAGSVYRVLGIGTDKVGVDLDYSQSWPSIRTQREAVSVLYTAGYDAAEIPAAIKAAALLMVGDLYEFRETAVVGTISAPIAMSPTVERLLAPYRVF